MARTTREEIAALRTEVKDLSKRVAALEGSDTPEAEPSTTPARKSNKTGGIILLIIGSVLSITIIGAIIGIPLIIIGAVLLGRSSSAAPTDEEEPEQDEATEPEPEARVPTKASSTKTPRGIDTNLVLRVLTIIGAVALVLGAGFFLTLAIERNWIGYLGRLAIGLVAGLAIAASGAYMRHRQSYAYWGDFVTSAGGIIAYLTVYVAYAFDAYRHATGLSTGALGAGLFLIAGLLLWYAAASSSRIVAIGSMVLGIATYAIGELSALSLIYVFALAAATRAAGAVRRWPYIGTSAVAIGSFGLALIGNATLPLGGFIAIAALAIISETFELREREPNATHAYLRGLVPLLVSGISMLLLTDQLGISTGATSIVIGLALIAASLPQRSHARTARLLGSIAFLTIGAGIVVSPAALGITWAVFGLVLIEAARRGAPVEIEGAGIIVSGFGYLAVILNDLGPIAAADPVTILALPEFYIALVSAAAYLIASLRARTVVSRVLSAGATFLLALIALLASPNATIAVGSLLALGIVYRCILTDSYYHVMSLLLSGVAILMIIIADLGAYVDHSTASMSMYLVALIGFSILHLYMRAQRLEEGETWIVPFGLGLVTVIAARLTSLVTSGVGMTLSWLGLGIAGLVAGIAGSDRNTRIAGLALIALAIVKAFAYDVFELELALRVVAFIVLGAALLGAALLYGKYRDRIGELF